MKKMIKAYMAGSRYKKISMAILLGISGVLLFSCKPQSVAELKTMAVDGGWGYQVVIDGKVFIDQKYIPCVRGGQRFQSEDEALKTGRLVLKKLRDGQMPTLKIQELDSIGVTYTP
jgi:hypothetical protein